MKLKHIFSRFKKEDQSERQFFLAVEISKETVKSALWSVEKEQTKIIKVGSLEDWDGREKKLLLAAVDASVTKASEGVKKEPSGVIFGLPQDWVKAEQIKTEKKELLKYICQKLELKPLGFVVILESLVAYLRLKEGTPVNAVFINLQETQSQISLVKLGKIIGTHEVGRSEDLAADVREGLARFGKVEDLPARMIMFDGEASQEEFRQQLISFNWPEHLPFLHFPKVESLEMGATIKATAIAGGAEVAKSLGLEIKAKEAKPEPTGAEDSEAGQVEAEERPEKEESTESVSEEKEEKGEGSSQPSQLTAEPVSVKPKTAGPSTGPEGEQSSSGPSPSEPSAAELGFVAGQDIAQLENKDQRSIDKSAKDSTEPTAEPAVKSTKDSERVKINRRKSLFLVAWLKKAFGWLGGLKRLIGGWLAGFGKSRARLIVGLGLVLLLLLAGAGLAFYWYVPKAKVTVYLKPKVLEKNLEIVIDPEATAVDVQAGVVPGEMKTVEVEGEKTKAATGEKTVGDQAKGQVTIYNKTDVAKTMAAGTVLVGPDNLTFSLDEAVPIASRSAEEEGIKFGKGTGAVTAVSIGTESNLPAGSELTFDEYPSSLYDATTKDGFSGGTSRQIKVVAEEDQEKLSEDLKKDLVEQAREKLKEKLPSGQKLIAEGFEEEVVSEEFSAETGEEAGQLSLKLKLKLKGFAYDQDKLETFLAQTMREAVPEDFVYNPENSEIKVEEISVEDGRAKLKAAVESRLLAKVDFEEIKAKLVGRYPEAVEEYLQTLPNFSRAQIEISPRLPKRLKTLPRLEKNIVVETQVE